MGFLLACSLLSLHLGEKSSQYPGLVLLAGSPVHRLGQGTFDRHVRTQRSTSHGLGSLSAENTSVLQLLHQQAILSEMCELFYRKQEQANRFCGQIKAIATPPSCLSLGPKVTRVSEEAWRMKEKWKHPPTLGESEVFSIWASTSCSYHSVRATVSSLLDSIQKTGGRRKAGKDDSGRNIRSGENREWMKKPDNPGVLRL